MAIDTSTSPHPTPVATFAERKNIVLFCLVTFVLSWGLQLAAIFLTPDIGGDDAQAWLLAAMVTPALAVLVLFAGKRISRRDMAWRFGWKTLVYAPAAVIVPTVAAFLAIGLLEFSGSADSKWFSMSSSGVAIAGGPWLLGAGQQSWLAFSINVLATGFAYSLLSAIPALGEELGWRGFLQPRLQARFGVAKAVIIVGLVWSFWHLPALLAGYNYADTPVLGAFVLSPLDAIATSAFLAWLTVRSGGFWLAALAHGAGNSIQEGLMSQMISDSASSVDLARLVSNLLVGAVFLILLIRSERARSDGPDSPLPALH